MFACYQSTTARHDLRAHDRSLFIDGNFQNQILRSRLHMGAPSLSARIYAGQYSIGRKLEVVVVSAIISVSLLWVYTVLGIAWLASFKATSSRVYNRVAWPIDRVGQLLLNCGYWVSDINGTLEGLHGFQRLRRRGVVIIKE